MINKIDGTVISNNVFCPLVMCVFLYLPVVLLLLILPLPFSVLFSCSAFIITYHLFYCYFKNHT